MEDRGRYMDGLCEKTVHTVPDQPSSHCAGTDSATDEPVPYIANRLYNFSRYERCRCLCQGALRYKRHALVHIVNTDLVPPALRF